MTAWTSLLLAAAACSMDEARRAAFEEHDSGGVRIVQSHEPEWGEAVPWRIAPIPMLVLGGAGSELHRVHSAFRDSIGRVLVVDAGALEIRLHDADGTLLRSAGGQGDGPGEFRHISGAMLHGDGALEVWNGLRYRTFYDAELRLDRTELLDPELLRSVAPYSGGARPIGDGSALVSGPMLETREPPVGAQFRMRYLHARVWPERGTADTLLELDGGLVEVYLGERRSMVVEFSPAQQIAAGRAGVFITDGAVHEVLHFDAESRLVRILRRSSPLREVTGTEAAAERARVEQLLRRSFDAADVSRRLAQLPAPRHYPAIDALVVDATGHVWAREPVALSDTLARWAVYGPSGRWLGHVSAPKDVRALDIGADYFLGLRRDELDQEFIVLHALRRTARDDMPR